MSAGNGNGNGRHWPSTIFTAVVIAALSGLVGHAIGYERAVERVDVVAKDVNSVQLALAAVQTQQAYLANSREEVLEAIDGLRNEVSKLNDQVHSMRASAYMRGGGG